MVTNIERLSTFKARGDAAHIRRGSVSQLLNLKKYDKRNMIIKNRLLSSIGCEFKVLNPLNSQEEEWHIRLAKASQEWNTSKKLLCLESDCAQYWVSNGLAFLGHLTGIYLKKSQIGMLNMVLPKIPEPMQSLFGWKNASVTSAPTNVYWLDFHYGSADVNLKVLLAMTNATCQRLVNQPYFKPSGFKPLSFDTSINTPISLGCINIGIGECGQIGPGDIVFIERTNFSVDGHGTFSLGSITIHSKIELIGKQYHLTMNRWESTMTKKNALAEEEEFVSGGMAISYRDEHVEAVEAGNESVNAQMLPMGDIPIKIDVRLGFIKFTLNDLQKMVEGKLYPIKSPGNGLVQLIHNEMEIARGQLVEVDGRLAIEIQKHWVKV